MSSWRCPAPVQRLSYAASPKPPIIWRHMSAGSQPPSPAEAIMFCIIPAIIPDIILGRALVAMATRRPPAKTPRRAASTYLRFSELVARILIPLYFLRPLPTDLMVAIRIRALIAALLAQRLTVPHSATCILREESHVRPTSARSPGDATVSPTNR